MNATVRSTGFRSILATVMAMAHSVQHNIANSRGSVGNNAPPVAPPKQTGICFHRTFTGKRVRNGKKKRNMNHVSKLTRMKHARA